jgi:hypothetical protein
VTLPPRVTVVTLGVADVQAATAFYQALGWPVSAQSGPGVTFIRTAGPVLALFGYADLAADAGVDQPQAPMFSGVTLAINLGSTQEVDAAFAAAVDAGAGVAREPAPTFWGGYSGYFIDPDGHRWELAHNPFWSLDDRGLVDLPD